MDGKGSGVVLSSQICDLKKNAAPIGGFWEVFFA